MMLDDVEAVKDYLFNAGLSVPYEWYQSGEVERRLTQMAEVKYNREGSKKALQIIDSMETQDVKRYLKQLIRDNMMWNGHHQGERGIDMTLMKA